MCVRDRESSKAGRGRVREGAHRETGEDKKDEWVGAHERREFGK